MIRSFAVVAFLLAAGMALAQAPTPAPAVQQLQANITGIASYQTALAALLKQIQAYANSCSVIPPALLQQTADVLAAAKANNDTATAVVAVVTGPAVMVK